MATPIILKENATHKAVKENNQISIYCKGFDIDDIHEDDVFMYAIPVEEEDDLFAIFERYDEDNRINMAEFKAFMQN